LRMGDESRKRQAELARAGERLHRAAREFR
jgi:hypothetical protein